MSDDEYRAYEGASPYFSLIRGALGDLVDGHHFFDAFAENAVFEVLYGRRQSKADQTLWRCLQATCMWISVEKGPR